MFGKDNQEMVKMCQEIIDLKTELKREKELRLLAERQCGIYYKEIRKAHKGIARLKKGRKHLLVQLALLEALHPIEVGNGEFDAGVKYRLAVPAIKS